MVPYLGAMEMPYKQQHMVVILRLSNFYSIRVQISILKEGGKEMPYKQQQLSF
jgi:hypothetical protein